MNFRFHMALHVLYHIPASFPFLQRLIFFLIHIMLIFQKTRRNTVFPLGIQEYHYTQRQFSQHETSRPHATDKGEESDESVCSTR
jgi:hypothetical protein